jgi:hypothetical protein
MDNSFHLLSFDIGIRNMAYCYASVDNNQINLINLNKIDLNIKKYTNTQTIINITIEFLDNLINNEINPDFKKLIVLIECQMTSIMKCIQTTINTYFKTISKFHSAIIETIYLSPKHKLTLINNHTPNCDYKKNKHEAILLTKFLLENKYHNPSFLQIFNSLKKKDDISDAFLMVIYYFELKTN